MSESSRNVLLFLVMVLCLVALVVLGVRKIACAEQTADLAVTWEYPDPPPDIEGFRLYQRMRGEQNATAIQDIAPEARSWNGTISLDPVENEFYMTAFDSGQESEPSNAVTVDPPPDAPNINIEVSITFNLRSN